MKSNKLFIVWGVIVLIIVGLLTTLGFMLDKANTEYKKLEDDLSEQVREYVDLNMLYPKGNKELKITTEELKEKGVYKELKKDNDVCLGYVIVKQKGVYEFVPYIKCDKYTTKGYQN